MKGMESRQFRRDGSLCYKEGCVQCNDRLVETHDKQQQVSFHVVISSGSFFHLWKHRRCTRCFGSGWYLIRFGIKSVWKSAHLNKTERIV